MATVKATAWNKEVEAQLIAAYAETKDIKALATQFGKTEASIRSKLVSLSVYEKAAVKTASTAKGDSKADMVSTIAKALGVTVESLESLEKASKGALQILVTKTASTSAEAE